MWQEFSLRNSHLLQIKWTSKRLCSIHIARFFPQCISFVVREKSPFQYYVSKRKAIMLFMECRVRSKKEKNSLVNFRTPLKLFPEVSIIAPLAKRKTKIEKRKNNRKNYPLKKIEKRKSKNFLETTDRLDSFARGLQYVSGHKVDLKVHRTVFTHVVRIRYPTRTFIFKT